MNFKLLSLVLLIFGVLNVCHAEDQFFNSNGVKIRYITEGEGEAVVLIHGWMSDSSMWGRDAAGNTKLGSLPGFKVIALDCRGHGKSDKPHDPKMYGPEMAADVVRLLDHLKIKRAHLMGYSMGAFLIGHIAATHPDRVISLIYGGQAPLIKGTHPQAFSEVDAFAKAVEDGKGLGPYIVAVAPAPKPTDEQAAVYAKILFGNKDVKAFAAAGKSFREMEVSVEAIQKCKAPVLFLYGGKESNYVKNRVLEVRKLLPDTAEKVVEGGDHMTTLAKPEFGKSLIEFLQQNKGR